MSKRYQYSQLKVSKRNSLKFNRLVMKNLIKSNLSQPKFAKKIGCSASLIAKIKGGKNYVHTLSQMLSMGEAMKYKKSYLYKLAGYNSLSKKAYKEEQQQHIGHKMNTHSTVPNNKFFTHDELMYIKGIKIGILFEKHKI